LLAQVVPWVRVNARHSRRMASDNTEMLQALGREPLYLRETRVDAVAGLVDLMVQAQAAAPRLKVPTLVLLGARDQMVPPASAKRFVATLTTDHCAAVTYPEGWHLLLRDHQRKVVFTDIAAWIADEPLPSGLSRACGPSPQS
jgi:alpha-beta hydrolase superfamily lysophospholipase